ncbi:transposase [Endozoicomonas sp. SM1973]|uniref:Transposase n=1 Tax=Spartinivicinus marinus TaxID=2994442 RepID=A0A853IK36_9GAMM|nr:IS3 family transposase [Spartinivicinus marinus]NYZ69747.1 transposase [Spartinivicinus marinus]
MTRPPTERFFRSYKVEWMPSTFYKNYQESEKDIMQYIKYYNHCWVHSYNGYLTPAAKELLV